MDRKIIIIIRLADQRDILVRLHPFLKKVPHSTIYTSIDDVIFIRPITAPLVCPYKPFNAFGGGGGFDHPPPNFRISQSERSI